MSEMMCVFFVLIRITDSPLLSPPPNNRPTSPPPRTRFAGGDDANGFAPSFTEKPRIVPNEAGTLITMKCRCKAKPAPQVTWYRGADVVQPSAKISIREGAAVGEEDIYELTLEIKVENARSHIYQK